MTCPRCTGEWDWAAQGSLGASATTASTTMPPREHARPGSDEPSRRAHWFPLRRGQRSDVMSLVFLGLVVFIGYRVKTYMPTDTPPQPLPGEEASLPKPKRPIWNLPPEQPLPNNGHGVLRFLQITADSKLHICPRGEQGHVVLKVEGADDARLVCWIFIRQGQSAETPIPSGSYRLKLACGKRWYGEEHLFGPGASYSAITTEIKIPTRTAYTIDLHPSKAGTLRETTLRAEKF